jgi:N6-adenosine-specific RNA methylase IME4
MKYGAILIDPPWSFKVWSKDTGHGRSAESHYPTMQPGELLTLPIQELAAPDCALFMWVTMPTLPQAIALGEAYGFQYKTAAFTWVKTLRGGFGWHFGMGYWTRANAELCLLFTKGSPKRKARNVRQVIIAPVGVHSAKPDEQYERIERLVDGPYVEVFARRPWPGWDAIGNEIDGRDVRDVLQEAANE